MNVKLVSYTANPVSVIAWAFANMHNEIPDSIDEFEDENRRKCADRGLAWGDIKDSLIQTLAINPHSSVLEFVNTVWYIGGCSRAFQQQLTRTREAAYSIQSLRIVPQSDFSSKGRYSTGFSIEGRNPHNKYAKIMAGIQDAYLDLIASGAKVEDARGILPLNIHSPITMAINLRALKHMLETRLCLLAQGEFRDVAEAMVKEVSAKMGESFRCLFKAPCHTYKFCPMPVHCGIVNYQQDNRYDGKHMDYWLKG